MSPMRTPSEEELALAESVFGIFQVFKSVASDAAQVCALGSPERARMLFGLKTGPVRAGLLAQRAHHSPSAISELVEGLEADGLVRREADPEDRRAVRVALTTEGRRQVQRFEQAAAIGLARRLADLTPAQRHRVRAAFSDLREVIAATDLSVPEANLRPTARGNREAASAR